jgi:hypothetical protein
VLVLGLIFLTLFAVATALFIGHARTRRRQLAEAQAYARIRALRGYAERQREMQPVPALPRRRTMRR